MSVPTRAGQVPLASRAPGGAGAAGGAGAGDAAGVPGAPTVYVAAGRGVPARTALGAAAVLCLVVAVVIGPGVGGLGALFDAVFVIAAVGATLVVSPRQLRAAVVAPPLLYAGGALVNGVVDGVTGTGSFALRQAANLAGDLIVGAPVLVGVTLGVLLLASLRGRAAQRRRRRVSAAGAPSRWADAGGGALGGPKEGGAARTAR